MAVSNADKKAITKRVAELLRQKGVNAVDIFSDVLFEVAKEFDIEDPVGGRGVVFSLVERDQELFEPADARGNTYRLKPNNKPDPEENSPAIEITYTEE